MMITCDIVTVLKLQICFLNCSLYENNEVATTKFTTILYQLVNYLCSQSFLDHFQADQSPLLIFLNTQDVPNFGM